MVEQTIIFGNGLGRAINNDFFSLDAALRAAWDEEDLLTARQKELISGCLPTDVLEEVGAPTREDQLEDLQRIVSACDEIASMERRINEPGEGWLSLVGQEFPTAIRTYLHRAARYFLDRDSLDEQQIPAGFADALRGHVLKKGANIVTLNYDDLLYECFIDTCVFKQHRLRDGFFNGVFDIEKHRCLLSKDVAREGWFLHLHGSPLFLTQGNVIKKLTRHALRDYQGSGSAHLVLTNVKYKASVIEASEILREYWRCFEDCCAKSSEILLIGYGGGDLHLNKAIARINPGAKIKVVQRRAEDRDISALKADWSKRFNGRDVEVVLCDSILDFRDF